MKILVDKAVIELALNALQGGLWDYGPGQDEHDKCNEVIAVLEDTLAQSADGMPVIKHCDVCGSDYWDGSRHPYPIYVANETIPEGFRTMEVRMKELQETKGEQIEAARQRLKDKINCVPSEDPDELLLQYKLRIKELESELDAHKAIANVFSKNEQQKPIGYIDEGDLRELSNGNHRQYTLYPLECEDTGRLIAIYVAPAEVANAVDWQAIGKEQLRRYEEKFGAISDELVNQEPDTWCSASTEELMLVLGKSPEEARRIHNDLKNCVYVDSIDFNQTPPYLRYDTGDSTPKENWTVYCDIQEDLRKAGYELTDSDVDHDTVCGDVTPITSKELTDNDIWQILETHSSDMLKAIRAAIAADREKNK